MKKLLGVLLLVLTFVGWGSYRIVASIQFDRNCGGHLKRAADANTVELAKSELATVVMYLEANRMTDGYTSVIYTTPNEDVGFWYTNLKSSLEELMKMSSEASPLERSNMLIKLRESLLDEGKNSTETAPSGISVYPNNTLVGFFGFLTFVLAVIGAIVFIKDSLDTY